MKKGQKSQFFFIMMFVTLMMTFNLSAASVLSSASQDTMIIKDGSYRSIDLAAKNDRVQAASSTFTVANDGWYILTIEMTVSNQVSTTTSYDLQLDGQPIQSIIFNTVNTTIKTTVAAYITSGNNHEITVSSPDVVVTSVVVVPAPVIKSSTLSIFSHSINFLSANTTISFAFFVEESASVRYEWSSLGSLTILEAKLDGTLIDLESFRGVFRDLASSIPHNLTFKISGIESLLGGPPGFSLTLKTLDETPPQLSNFAHGTSPIVDNKLFNVTVTFNLEDDISGVLVDSVTVKYLAHDSITDRWDNSNRTAQFASVSSNNVTFQFLIPFLKVGVDKLIVYIFALDRELNEMEVEQLITLDLETTVTGQPTPSFEFAMVMLVLIGVSPFVLSYHEKKRY